jgi:hypothetical protein
LRAALNARTATLAADGWQIGDIPRNCSLVFFQRGNERVCVSIECSERHGAARAADNPYSRSVVLFFCSRDCQAAPSWGTGGADGSSRARFVKDKLSAVMWTMYFLGDAATFVYLTFFDHYAYNSWNWLIAIPTNFLLAMLWPVYWAILRPLFG